MPGLLVSIGAKETLRLTFGLGFVAGFIFQLITLRWLCQIPVEFLPYLGWTALSAFLALLPAAWLTLVMRTAPHPWPPCQPTVQSASLLASHSTWVQRQAWSLMAAAAWVAFEMVQTRIFSGFPWNLLATSQTSMLPLIQLAEFTGVYGVSFVMVFTSLSFVHATHGLWAAPKNRLKWQRDLAPAIAVVLFTIIFGARELLLTTKSPQSSRTLRIALIQPNIPQTMIWDSSENDQRFAQLLQLSKEAMSLKPDLMLWPEAATPYAVRHDAQTRAAIRTVLSSYRTWLATGSDDATFEIAPDGSTSTNYTNSAFLIAPDGSIQRTYPKRHLVMFGEFIPWSETFPWLRRLTPITGGYSPGKAPVTFDLPAHRTAFGILICFEDGFPHLVREHAQNVDFLVNLTNDGWFGEKAAQWQHAASAVFRAIENRLPLVRACNNGLSCWIDSQGRVKNVYFEGSENIYQAGIKLVQIPLPSAGDSKKTTFYHKHGDVFGWLMCALSLVLARPMNRKSVLPTQVDSTTI